MTTLAKGYKAGVANGSVAYYGHGVVESWISVLKYHPISLPEALNFNPTYLFKIS